MLNPLDKKPMPTDDFERHKKFVNMFKEAVGMNGKDKVEPASTQPAALAEMYKNFCEL